MRISKFLIESTVSDIFSGEFEKFISDYNLIYSSRLFVAFTDNESFNDNDLPVSEKSGMHYVYPIKDVLERPSQYTDYAETSYLHVVKHKSVFDINQAQLKHVKSLADSQNISKEQFDKIIAYFNSNYKTKTPSIESYMFSKLLFNNISINERDEIEFERANTNKIKKRLRGMGIKTLIQSQGDGHLIDPNHNIIAISSSSAVSKDVYKLGKEESSDVEEVMNDGEIYFRDREYMREVADKVAEGLGTKLNSDPVYSMFLDYYYWTTDGIEMVITVAFSDSEVSSTHDNVYYVVEAFTPYGVMVTRIEADKDLDNIADDIRKTYAYHVTPNESWEPQNRDLFLDNERKEYKLFDAHYDDVVKVVDEYYPSIYNLARTYNIGLPVLSYYGSFDKVYIHQFIEFLASNPTSSVKLMKELEDKNYDFDNLFYVPMPRKITIDILKSISMIYSEMKKRKPSAKGWYLFKEK